MNHLSFDIFLLPINLLKPVKFTESYERYSLYSTFCILFQNSQTQISVYVYIRVYSIFKATIVAESLKAQHASQGVLSLYAIIIFYIKD